MVGALLALALAFCPISMAAEMNAGCFRGLNDSDAAATINDCDAQSALNVEPNQAGTAIKKREGYSLSATVTYSTAPIEGAFNFIAPNGDRIDIVCYDVYCDKSVNGTTFAHFLTTASLTATRWSFVAVNGTVYGANDARDKVFTYDGTTLLYPSGIPQGSVLELNQGRLIVSDTSANPNRANYSQKGAYTTFTTGTDDVSAWTDDLGSPGDKITGAKCDRGMCYFFKTNSITVCEVGTQYTTECQVLASYLGTKDPASIISTPLGIQFKGDDGHIWNLADGRLQKLTQNISTLIKTQPSGAQRLSTINTKAGWDAGTQVPSLSWNTDTTLGSIFPSSNTVVTSSITLSLGTSFNLVIDASGVRLSSSVVQDDFTDSAANCSTGQMAWTDSGAGSPSCSSDKMRFDGSGTGGSVGTQAMWSTVGFSSGALSVDIQCYSGSGSLYGDLYVIVDADGTTPADTNGYAALYRYRGADAGFYMFKMDSGGSDTLISSSAFTDPGAGSEHIGSITMSRDASGAMLFVVDTQHADISLTGTNTAYSGKRIIIASVVEEGKSAYNIIDNLYYYNKDSSGTLTTQPYDSSYSTPTYGTFLVAMSSTSSDTITFSVQSASSTSGEWSATASQTNNEKIAATGGRKYVRFVSTFQATSSSTTFAEYSSVSLYFATTGQYTTSCIQPGSNISAWGTLSCSETTAGGGSLSYTISTGTTCGTLGTYYSQTNNATIGADTAPAVSVRFTSLLTSATDQAQVDACTVYWNEGSVAPPTFGVYDSVNDVAYWAIASGNVAANNRVLRYDLNLNSWLPWDLAAGPLLARDKEFYFGSSSGGYWYKFGGVSNDAGSAIESYWKSRDFTMGAPFQEKNFTALSLVARNQQTGSLDLTITGGDGHYEAYTVSLDTDSAKPYIRSNYALPLLSPQTFMNVQFGNNAANQPWEVDGYRLDYTVDDWRPIEK